MRVPTRFYLLIASFVFFACGASDELRDSPAELSDDFTQIAGLPYAVGIFSGTFPSPGPRGLHISRRLNQAAEADWLVKDLLIKRDGELRLGLEFHYRSPIPDTSDEMPLTFIGSALFLELIGIYVSTWPFTSGERRGSMILFSPIVVDRGNVHRAIVTYKGNFRLPDAYRAERWPLDYLGIGFAWLRVYQTPQGQHLYELMYSSRMVPPDFKVDTTYEKVAGSFELIYLPFPESQMGVTYIWDMPSTETDFFDYVAWVQENLLVPKKSKLQPNFPNP